MPLLTRTAPKKSSRSCCDDCSHCDHTLLHLRFTVLVSHCSAQDILSENLRHTARRRGRDVALLLQQRFRNQWFVLRADFQGRGLWERDGMRGKKLTHNKAGTSVNISRVYAGLVGRVRYCRRDTVLASFDVVKISDSIVCQPVSRNEFFHENLSKTESTQNQDKGKHSLPYTK